MPARTTAGPRDAASRARELRAAARQQHTHDSFARAILSLTARSDFDHPAFVAWLARNKPATFSPPTVAQLRAAQNWKNVLAKLEVLLANDPAPSEIAAAARTALRTALKTLF